MGRGQGDGPYRVSSIDELVWGRQKWYDNGKMDREEGDEICAEAREMGCIEYRRIGMGEEAGGEVHQCNSCRNSLRQCMGGGVKKRFKTR